MLISFSSVLWIRFPVWRELKLKSKEKMEESLASGFGSAFPFEGNWNENLKRQTLSRLCFGYAFPFEGNWNYSSRLRAVSTLTALWIRFPVWRELKLNDLAIGNLLSSVLWIRFPVWRELKLCVCVLCNHRQCKTLWIRFPVWRELKHLSPPVLSTPWVSTLDPLSRLKGIETRGDTYERFWS